MIEPPEKPPVWQPDMYLLGDRPQKPINAGTHFLVNSSRQIIMRAMLSSRSAYKQSK